MYIHVEGSHWTGLDFASFCFILFYFGFLICFCRAVNLFPKSISLWLNKRNIPTSLFVGKYLFMPDDDIDFTVVVGRTIKFPRIEQPSAEDIDRHHKMWMDAFVELFNRHKGKYAATGDAAELEVY